jgi:hypothetical protein
MKERVNPKFVDAVRHDQGTGLPLFDSAVNRTAPPETVTPSETRRESYLKLQADPKKLNAMQTRILTVIRARGPVSSREIEKVTKIPRHIVTARIVELRDDLGLIVKVCDEKGNAVKKHDDETNRMVEVYVAKDAPAEKPVVPQPAGNAKHYTEFTDVFYFGKHRGKTVDQVLDEDPRWLEWAVLKDVITLSPKLEDDLVIALKK